MLGWLDPSLSSKNLGDEIIRDAVQHELSRLNISSTRLPTQRLFTVSERRKSRSLSQFVVGGTNLLNGNIPRYLQWKIDPRVYTSLKGRTSLLGVGWWQYQSHTNSLSAAIWRSMLGNAPQSVRDSYTADKLQSIGIRAINTSCPTVWGLEPEPERCSGRGSDVVLALTDYNRHLEDDKRLVRILNEAYDRVLVWPQGAQDATYLASLSPGVRMLDRSVEAFTRAVSNPGTDYVGTRLHAGVRALQVGARATIIAVDNRAQEMAKDTGLPVVGRDLNSEAIDFIRDDRKVRVRIPHNAIKAFRSEFDTWLAATNDSFSIDAEA